MSKYHEKFILPDNTITNDESSDKSISELTDEIQNKIQTALKRKKMFSIIGSVKAQSFDPQKLILFEIEKID